MRISHCSPAALRALLAACAAVAFVAAPAHADKADRDKPINFSADQPAEVDFAAAGANRVALVADPSGAALFLYQLDERATADPGAIADARRASSSPPPPRPSGGDSNIRVSVTVGYGFGPGWGSAYPSYLRPTLGPY